MRLIPISTCRLIAALLLVVGIVGCSGSPPTLPVTSTQRADPPKPVDVPQDSPTDPAAEANAVKFVEMLGGKFTRDHKRAGNPVVQVDLRGTAVTDAGLKELAPLKNLTHIQLSDNKLTDRTLAAAREINLLHALDVAWAAGGKRPSRPEDVIEINLNASTVTDAGLKELAQLKNLTELLLYKTHVTDAGLKELAPFTKLTILQLGHTKVGDAGMKDVALLKNLTILRMDGTKVSDAGLKEIAKLSGLTKLDLAYTKVTDAGLKEIAKLDNLTSLHLVLTDITDAGLKELAPLKKLTILGLRHTKVTEKGIAQLQQLLPNCHCPE